MSYKVKLLIQYDGTDFEGWQRQPEGKPTIQALVEKAVSQIFAEEIHVQASGRTDSGVHALGQVAHFKTSKNPDSYNLVKAINSLLPRTIGIKKAWLAPDDFHAQRSATSKTYIYRIWNSKEPDPIKFRYSTWLRREMDMAKLNALSECFVGEKDFKSFQTSGTAVKTTIRCITEARWSPWEAEGLQFTVSGTGFLKQMVRNIVGTLIYMDQNNGSPTELQSILEAKDRTAAKGTAPAQGLFLESVCYPAELDNRCREI